MLFKCDRCGYVTTVKCNFLAHLQRKVQCEPILSNIPQSSMLSKYNKDKSVYKCEFCSKTFATPSNKLRHERNSCKSGVGSLAQYKNEFSQNEFSQVLQKLEEVQNELKIMKNESTRPNITVINNNNITLNAFEFENLDHIKNNKLFLTRCLMYRNMTGLLEKVYCDSKHPENHNVKVPNKKQPYIQYYDGETWRYEQKDDVLDKMVNNGKNILDEHFVYNEDEIKQFVGKLFDQIVAWMDDIKYNHKTVNELKERAYLMLLSHRTKAQVSESK